MPFGGIGRSLCAAVYTLEKIPPLPLGPRAFCTSSKLAGLLNTGGAQEGLEVLALDDKLLVALESRPASGGEATGTRKFAIDKFRLLVRA